MERIIEALREFTAEREWEQFHTPENLAKSVCIEAGELLECFQWNDKFDKEHLCEEIADVLSYCIMLADRIGVDVEEIVLSKIEKNKLKYPVDKAKGSSVKYNELQNGK